MTDRRTTAFADVTESDVRAAFDAEDYVADDDVVTTVLLALRLGKPLLVEGEPGAGKTELAKVLAAGFDTDLVRLQCYEGLTAESALYEWNYTKQLLAVQAGNRSNGSGESGEHEESVFTEEYLLERPLLRALRSTESGSGDSDESETPPVLLIDEVDRADEEFEALLLEVLSDFQVSVPELGTVRAETPPVVVVTSNRTRGLSDALKRRCLYLHVSPPSFEKERAILARKVPELDGAVAAELCSAARRLREEPLRKPPGAAETIDWARAVAELRTNGVSGSRADDQRESAEGASGATASREGEPSERATGGSEARGSSGDQSLTSAEVEQTLGCLLKEVEDVERVDDDLLADLLEAASEDRESAGTAG